MTQPAIARRVGRDPARISELERDLLRARWGRDRLTLLAEMCDALDLIPVLVPRGQADVIRGYVEGTARPTPGGQRPSVFDEVFVDLGEDQDEDL